MLKQILITGAVLVLCTPLYAAQTTAPQATTPQASAPQATGEMMGNTCAGCHGTHGRLSAEAFVPLAGMKESTFIKAMQDFRSGARPATLMGHVARGYNDEQVKAMAEFFAKVKP